MFFILLIIILICAFQWLRYYITAVTLLYYMEVRSCTLTDQEFAEYLKEVIYHILAK